MKTIHIVKLICLIIYAMRVSESVYGQGTFQDLNFESPMLPFVSVGDPVYPFVYSSNAMPGWTLYLGANSTSAVLFNDLFSSSAAVQLLGPGWTGGGIIDGNYTAVLQAGDGPNSGFASASIAQTGIIPAGAKSIFISEILNATPAVISVGGQNVSMVPLSTNSSITVGGVYPVVVFGGDISTFAGQTEQLEITASDTPNQFAFDYIDDIQFSLTSIPEPDTYALLLCGGAVFAFNRWRRRSL